MAARKGAFNDKALYAPGCPAQQHGGQGIGGYNRKKRGPVQCGQGHVVFDELTRVEDHPIGLGALHSPHLDGVGDALMVDQGVQDTGNLKRNPCAHDHDADSRQHGSVNGGKMGELDLFEIVDSDRIGVSFPGQEHFNKIGGDAHFLGRAITLHRMKPAVLVRGCVRLPAWHEIVIHDSLDHFREGKVAQGTADMSFRIAVLETTDQDMVEPGAGYKTELAKPRDGLGKLPIRDSGTHPPLDNFRNKRFHCLA